MPHRFRRRRRRVHPAAAAAAAVLALAALTRTPAAGTSTRTAAASRPAATAIAYARDQLGKPYVYGATGPDAFDCSGLVQAAWQAAGVSIPRTSEEQWAQLPHVSSPQPGDLVFYTGSPIDPPPGHVTMYVGGGQMIEAYGAGVPIRVTALRSGVWGYAAPGGAS